MEHGKENTAAPKRAGHPAPSMEGILGLRRAYPKEHDKENEAAPKRAGHPAPSMEGILGLRRAYPKDD